MGRNDLIPLNKRTKEERKRICSNGGKKSGEARRKQRTMRNIFRMVKGLRINDAEICANLRELGIKEKDMTYGVLFAVSVFNNAMKGNAKMAELVLKVMGEGTTSANAYQKGGIKTSDIVVIIDDIPLVD